MKILFVIYADTKLLLETLHTCDNVPPKNVHIKNKQIRRVVIRCSHTVHLTVKKLDFCRIEDSKKKFCTNLREHATEITNCKKRSCYCCQKRGKHTRNQNSVTYTYAHNNLVMNLRMMKIIIRFKITVITHKNLEVMHVVSLM